MNEWPVTLYNLPLMFLNSCQWIVYRKVVKSGWGSTIPIHNIVLLCNIAGMSRWWTLVILFPLINIFMFMIPVLGVVQSYERSLWFGLGLLLLSIIFYAILAFSDISYRSRLRLHH